MLSRTGIDDDFVTVETQDGTAGNDQPFALLLAPFPPLGKPPLFRVGLFLYMRPEFT
jgi:hypothetical protein